MSQSHCLKPHGPPVVISAIITISVGASVHTSSHLTTAMLRPGDHQRERWSKHVQTNPPTTRKSGNQWWHALSQVSSLSPGTGAWSCAFYVSIHVVTAFLSGCPWMSYILPKAKEGIQCTRKQSDFMRPSNCRNSGFVAVPKVQQKVRFRGFLFDLEVDHGQARQRAALLIGWNPNMARLHVSIPRSLWSWACAPWLASPNPYGINSPVSKAQS